MINALTKRNFGEKGFILDHKKLQSITTEKSSRSLEQLVTSHLKSRAERNECILASAQLAFSSLAPSLGNGATHFCIGSLIKTIFHWHAHGQLYSDTSSLTLSSKLVLNCFPSTKLSEKYLQEQWVLAWPCMYQTLLRLQLFMWQWAWTAPYMEKLRHHKMICIWLGNIFLPVQAGPPDMKIMSIGACVFVWFLCLEAANKGLYTSLGQEDKLLWFTASNQMLSQRTSGLS